MQILLNIQNESVSQKILDFLSSSFKKNDLSIQTLEDTSVDKKHQFSEFSGLWKDRNINIETIRESAWKK
ncbi:hypothetical protein JHD49_09565 [Sulfurimonas sp. SAG-AH-194-C21]|nr:hypothetical protein [Sulfurimonas sp. SAG-AH-194-C21]MDF1884187.1 hypothetical protein [Sulfurimonas sp. SAG-AH-194-C21]